MHTHINIRVHMHKNTCAHLRHRPNTLKNGYRNSKFMHKHAYTYIYTCIYIHACTYTYTHADIYIYACSYTHIHTHIYTHAYKMYICTLCMFIHTHTYTHVHTHIQDVHMHARKHAWNDGAAATA